MGAKIGRSDFRRQYPAVYQGLFVFSDAKRLPKDQPIINLGYELSERLMGIPADRRCFEIDSCLRNIVEAYLNCSPVMEKPLESRAFTTDAMLPVAVQRLVVPCITPETIICP